MSGVDIRTTNHNWAERNFEKFPWTLFSGVQSFIIYQNFTDFLGGVVEFPLALLQYPIYLTTGKSFSFPSRQSQIQYLLNLGRFRSIHSDVV